MIWQSQVQFETKRLVLRRWQNADRAPFAALNADPVVTEFLAGMLTAAESDSLVDRIESHFDTNDFGLWAVTVKNGPAFIGFVGLSRPTFVAHFTPCVEIGWRLDRAQWGKGYATEAARETLRIAFELFDIKEVVSFTATGNVRSRRVMEKIGMTRDPADDFEHPRLPKGHPLRNHVLCRIRKGTGFKGR